jgi:hypothetical protein
VAGRGPEVWRRQYAVSGAGWSGGVLPGGDDDVETEGLELPHRHSGIGLHTPETVHDGTAWQIRARRQEVLDAAYVARPDRFRSRPVAPKLPAKAWINKPRPTIESQEYAGITHAA